MAQTPQSSPSLKIRIDLDAEDRIGPGKIRLLEAIDTCGSISAAGRMMNMSYKHAWDLVDEIARICKHDVIISRVGGNHPLPRLASILVRKSSISSVSALRARLLFIARSSGWH
jgi:molybdate transport repressor ModE-like protein